jgi:uncharacterized protein (DUF2249 family)
MPRIDVRDLPPAQRHPLIKTAFEEMDRGETLELVNAHEPKPLFYEFRSEVEAFDADGYEVEQSSPGEYVASFPKQ